MITIQHKGSVRKMEKFLKKMSRRDVKSIMNKYGQLGVDALRNSTPKDSGLTADSWDYEIHVSGTSAELVWTNNNFNKGVNVAILIQYGHGMRQGGYVKGIDFINPSLNPLFKEMADEAWQEVINS